MARPPLPRPWRLRAPAKAGDALYVSTQVLGADRNFALRFGAMSGPSFAKEVARGDPTAITIASSDMELSQTVQQALSAAADHLMVAPAIHPLIPVNTI